MTTYASWFVKEAPLSSPFGLDYACRSFGKTEAEIEALVGRITRGPRRGQLRGVIRWVKVESGGWVKTGAYDHDRGCGSGFVVRPGQRGGHQLVIPGWGYTEDKYILGPSRPLSARDVFESRPEPAAVAPEAPRPSFGDLMGDGLGAVAEAERVEAVRGLFAYLDPSSAYVVARAWAHRALAGEVVFPEQKEA